MKKIMVTGLACCCCVIVIAVAFYYAERRQEIDAGVRDAYDIGRHYFLVPR